MQFNFNKVNSKQKFNEGTWIAIKLDGEEIGAEFKVLSRHSDMGEKLQQARTREMHRAFKKENKFVLPDPADSERDRLEFVVALTTDWRGPALEGEDGKVPPFTAAALTEFLKREKWVLPQLDEGIGDDARFLKA